MTEVVDLASALIAIPSHEDEDEAGSFIERWLRDHTDADIERDDVGNVIATRGPASGPSLALVGHHDVVPPDPTQVANDGSMVVERDGDRLCGRGSADMKGAVAAMLLAFRDADPHGPLHFASFVGEETGGEGARYAVSNGFVPTYAVVGEGSAGYAHANSLDVVIAHRGRRGSTAIARGAACHASEPDAGVNAIYRATEAIDRLRTVEPPTLEVAGETLSGTLEVTRIVGGTADNVVPDECTVTLDERTLPDRRIDLEAALAAVEGVDIRIDQDWPPMRCSDDQFATAIVHAIDTCNCGPSSRVTKPHATDASWLAEAGAATVVVGPAERGEAHTADESVGIELLKRAQTAYRAIASSVERPSN